MDVLLPEVLLRIIMDMFNVNRNEVSIANFGSIQLGFYKLILVISDQAKIILYTGPRRIRHVPSQNKTAEELGLLMSTKICL